MALLGQTAMIAFKHALVDYDFTIRARSVTSVGDRLTFVPPSFCPVCASMTLRKLDAPSEFATVNYYRCAQCGHVWTAVKGDSAKITHITEFPRKPRTTEPSS